MKTQSCWSSCILVAELNRRTSFIFAMNSTPLITSSFSVLKTIMTSLILIWDFHKLFIKGLWFPNLLVLCMAHEGIKVLHVHWSIAQFTQISYNLGTTGRKAIWLKARFYKVFTSCWLYYSHIIVRMAMFWLVVRLQP